MVLGTFSRKPAVHSVPYLIFPFLFFPWGSLMVEYRFGRFLPYETVQAFCSSQLRPSPLFGRQWRSLPWYDSPADTSKRLYQAQQAIAKIPDCSFVLLDLLATTCCFSQSHVFLFPFPNTSVKVAFWIILKAVPDSYRSLWVSCAHLQTTILSRQYPSLQFFAVWEPTGPSRGSLFFCAGSSSLGHMRPLPHFNLQNECGWRADVSAWWGESCTGGRVRRNCSFLSESWPRAPSKSCWSIAKQ